MTNIGEQSTGRRRPGGTRGSTGPASREAIMDAAQRLFADAGYAATSTAKVATAAGVPHGLVFYYFPTKRDLLLTVVTERAYRGSLRTTGTESAASDVEQILRRAAGELLELFTRNRDTQIILFREAGTDPELHAMVSSLVASSTGDLAELLAGAVDAPPDAASTLATARLLVSSLLMDTFLRQEGPDPTRVEDTVRLLADGLRRQTTRKDERG